LAGKGQAAKRNRQSELRRQRNKMIRSRVRSSTRKLTELVETKAEQQAVSQYKAVASLLDSAVSKGIIHRNTAARKKSRLSKKLGRTGQTS
jgi:small subunit ribosomal protein S20